MEVISNKDSDTDTDYNNKNKNNFYRSISFLADDKKSARSKKNRTKSFQRDSNLLELQDVHTMTKNTLNNFEPFSYRDPEDKDSIIYESSYPFAEKYLTLNNKTQKNSNNIPDDFRHVFQVFVRQYNLKSNDEFNFFNFVTYKIEGNYDSRNFSVERRYKEFILFRKHLLNNFPGMFVPPIPPKKAFGNLEEGFIKLRKKFLQNFFNKIANCPHLQNCEQTRNFLNPEVVNYLEFYDQEKDQKNQKFSNFENLKKIHEFYSQYFNFLYNEEFNLSTEKIRKINNLFLHLNKSKEMLENLLLIATEAENNKLEFDMEIKNLYENFYQLDNNYFYEMFKIEEEKKIEYNKNIVECGIIENMYKTKFVDFYNCFFEWTNVELIETETFLELIFGVLSVKEYYLVKSENFKNEENYLNKLEKPNWIKAILFKNEKKINLQKEKVEIMRKEFEMIKDLVELLYKIVIFIEIPIFKNERINFYRKFLMKLRECNIHEKDKLNLIKNSFNNNYLNLLEYYEKNCD